MAIPDNMKRLIIGSLAVIGLLAVGAVGLAHQGSEQTVRNSPQRETGDETRHALSIPTSVAQIGDFSDLVVRGSVVSSTTVEKRPAVETDDYTAAAKERYANLVVNLDKFTFHVDEYYKGSGGNEITIMADPSSWTLESDVSYVLFLFQSPTPEGRTYWENGYLIHGWQGLWKVEETNAVRVEDSETVALDKFSRYELPTELIR